MPFGGERPGGRKCGGKMGSFGVLLDVLTVAAGIFLLVAPNKAYNVGRKEPQEPPANWAMKGRLFGVFFLIVGGIFIYFSYFA